MSVIMGRGLLFTSLLGVLMWTGYVIAMEDDAVQAEDVGVEYGEEQYREGLYILPDGRLVNEASLNRLNKHNQPYWYACCRFAFQRLCCAVGACERAGVLLSQEMQLFSQRLDEQRALFAAFLAEATVQNLKDREEDLVVAAEPLEQAADIAQEERAQAIRGDYGDGSFRDKEADSRLREFYKRQKARQKHAAKFQKHRNGLQGRGHRQPRAGHGQSAHRGNRFADWADACVDGD